MICEKLFSFPLPRAQITRERPMIGNAGSFELTASDCAAVIAREPPFVTLASTSHSGVFAQFGSLRSYTFAMEAGYVHKMPFVGEETCGPSGVVEREFLRDGNGFHPTYYGAKATFLFVRYCDEDEKRWIGERFHDMAPYIHVTYSEKDHNVAIEVRDRVSHILEFHFFPHNLGVRIGVLARRS